tara:strand:+ start:253 stop:933 length:681 start_codon:yes stop_codon:yes gene_type:complete
MNKVFKRGSIEFLAVFLGIALSLWVDDYREDRELNNRLNDDLKKIYSEVQSNIQNIENIIRQNNNFLDHEEKLLMILNGDATYNFDNVINIIDSIRWPTFFGETTAYSASVSSGRFNTSENDTLVRNISLLYEHFFVRLTLNGDILDQKAFEFNSKHSINFNKAIFKQQKVDTLGLSKYFFSNDFHNGLLSAYEIRKDYYMKRLDDTRNQLYKVKSIYDNSYFDSL